MITPRRPGEPAGPTPKHDLTGWPNRQFSRFVHAAGIDWHVQIAGHGDVVLLVHGAGAATHSWRDLLPLLAERFKVVAMDLPGHGFTDPARWDQSSLPGMSRALGKLLHTLDIEPDLAVGHSAGAAILTRMCLDDIIAPRALMSLNGAFLPFGGIASQIFSPLAKVLALNPFVPRLFAWKASDIESVARLVRETGSTIDRDGLGQYARLLRDHRHVYGALRMMANWDLSTIAREMRDLDVPLTLVVGERDRAVAPAEADEIVRAAPRTKLVRLPKLGHLAHEESPAEIARLIVEMAEPTPAA